jgi:acyl-CoA thioesterase-1
MFRLSSLLTALLFCAAGFGQSKQILVLGDSLTAGYGIGKERAFPALLQERLQSEGLDYQVINAGLSGDTSAGGLRRVNWVLRQPVDVLILGLGANDGLRGVHPDVTYENLQQIIDKTKAKFPGVKVLIAGMQMPPNLGSQYTDAFRELFPRLAEANQAALIPFLLKDVAGRPKLNLEDGIHPTVEGHRIMAETVWTHLEPLLESAKVPAP